MRLRPVLVVAGAALVLGLSVWWFTCPSNDVPDSDLPTGVTGRIVTLASVSNASGLAVVEHNGRRVAATVDEVDEWRGEGDPPPLIVLSSLETGEQVGGVLSIGMFGEVEALARRDGRWAFPYKTGAQRVVVRDGNNDINVIGPAVISQLRDASAALVEGPLYFEFEGLDSSEKGWEFVVAVVEPDARDTPRSTKLSFRFWCNFDGTEPTLSPAVRWPDERLYTDYVAGLDVLDSGVAVVPGFFGKGVVLIDRQGRIVKHIPLPTSRVEGVVWDAAQKELLLSRECPGTGTDCADGEFGAPLWIFSFTEDLVSP